MKCNAYLTQRIAMVMVLTMMIGALFAGGAAAAGTDATSSLNKLGTSASSSGVTASTDYVEVSVWVTEDQITHGDTITVNYRSDDHLQDSETIRVGILIDGEYSHSIDDVHFKSWETNKHVTQTVETTDLPNENSNIEFRVLPGSGGVGGGEVDMQKNVQEKKESGGYVCGIYFWGTCWDWTFSLL